MTKTAAADRRDDGGSSPIANEIRVSAPAMVVRPLAISVQLRPPICLTASPILLRDEATMNMAAADKTDDGGTNVRARPIAARPPAMVVRPLAISPQVSLPR